MGYIIINKKIVWLIVTYRYKLPGNSFSILKCFPISFKSVYFFIAFKVEILHHNLHVLINLNLAKSNIVIKIVQIKSCKQGLGLHLHLCKY